MRNSRQPNDALQLRLGRRGSNPCVTQAWSLGCLGSFTRMKESVSKFSHGVSWVAAVLTAIASILWVAIIVTQDGWGALFYMVIITPWVGGGALFLGLIPSSVLYARFRQRRDLRSIWLSGVSVLMVAAETAGLFVYPTHAC